MNQEQFGKVKTLLKSRYMQNVELALQLVYAQGTNKQKEEIETMSIVLMTCSPHADNIRWAVKFSNDLQHADSNTVWQSAALHLVSLSLNSATASPEFLESLVMTFDAVENSKAPKMVRRIATILTAVQYTNLIKVKLTGTSEDAYSVEFHTSKGLFKLEGLLVPRHVWNTSNALDNKDGHPFIVEKIDFNHE